MCVCFLYICIHCSSSGLSQGHAGKCVRGSEGRSARESVSSAALVLVEGAAGPRMILLIGAVG